MRVHPSLLGLVVEIVKIHTDERIYNNPSEWGSPYAKPFLIIFDKSLVMDFKQNKSTGVLWVLNGFDGFIFFLKMFWKCFACFLFGYFFGLVWFVYPWNIHIGRPSAVFSSAASPMVAPPGKLEKGTGTFLKSTKWDVWDNCLQNEGSSFTLRIGC